MSKLSGLGRTALVAVLVVLMIVASAAGYLASNSRIISSTATAASSICTQIGVGNIFLAVKSSYTNQSIQGLPVQIKEMSGECPGQELNLGNFTTDTNGTVMTGGQGTFYFTVRFNGTDFNAIAELAPMGVTCLTLYVPSGETSNSSGQYGSYSCNAQKTTNSNTYFSTSCSISGVGGFEFRLVSDSTEQPVNASSISAVDKLGCNNENQVVYLNNFAYLGDGWFVPIFPNQAVVGGDLNITLTYVGETYNFTGYYPPVGTDCVTIHVPSDNLSSTIVMNGSGSNCSAGTATSTLVTQTSAFSSTTLSSSPNKLGLELFASVNSTDLSESDSGLLLNITLMNTLSIQNTVSYANSWAIANMNHFGEPCNFYSPTGFAVFSGYYESNNISQATPLNLWPVTPECPAAYIFNGSSSSSIIGVLQNVTSYSFLPNSDRSNYSGYYIPENSYNGSIIFGTFPTTVSFDQGLSIYSSSEPTISYTPSATSSVYTIAVGDEWGDLVLIHFSVSGCSPFGCDESTITASSGETP